MQRPESHTTAYDAERIFLSALPASWVPRKQDPDYGIDFRVEVFEHGRSTGFHCAVQVRGSRSLTTSTDTIRSRLATRHLQQFVEIERQPVFLVVVDVVRKEAFWIFVQEWEAKFRRRETWRSQKSVTITIPAANRLSNSRLFRQALRHADTFMATRKAEAVTDAIKDSAAALKAAKQIQRSTGTQSMALRQRSRFAVLTVDRASRIRIPLNLVPWVVNKRCFRHLFPLSFLYGPEYYGPLDAWAIADLHGDAEEFNGLPPSDWFISPATLSARAADQILPLRFERGLIGLAPGTGTPNDNVGLMQWDRF